MIEPLPDVMMRDVVSAALREDMGCGGDITSAALVAPDKQWKAALVARANGVMAGLDLARLAFAQMDEKAQFTPRKADGEAVTKGEVLAIIEGNARALLAAERTALNFLCHLSGIASLTRAFVDAAKPHKAKICDTRKTTPTFRFLEKYAVRAGGGANHRMGLDDAVLIKDNHIAVNGDVRSAVIKARAAVGHMVRIEAEVDTLGQLRTLLDTPVDVVMLDNMDLAQMAEAALLVAGRFVLEASGGVTLDTVAQIAATGVDVISVGALTHSAPILDIALDDFFSPR